MRILVVDDSEDSRDLTEGALLSAGYTDIVTAGSGWEALKVLDVGRTTEEKPAVDVVLLDIVMPEMDGVEACARIRNDPRYADLPIIMVTSLDDMNSLVECFRGRRDRLRHQAGQPRRAGRARARGAQAQAGTRSPPGARARTADFSVELGRPPRRPVDRRGDRPVRRRSRRGLSRGRVRVPVDEEISIVALTLDRFDVYRAANGEPRRGACSPKCRARCAGSRRRSASSPRPIATA